MWSRSSFLAGSIALAILGGCDQQQDGPVGPPVPELAAAPPGRPFTEGEVCRRFRFEEFEEGTIFSHSNPLQLVFTGGANVPTFGVRIDKTLIFPTVFEAKMAIHDTDPPVGTFFLKDSLTGDYSWISEGSADFEESLDCPECGSLGNVLITTDRLHALGVYFSVNGHTSIWATGLPNVFFWYLRSLTVVDADGSWIPEGYPITAFDLPDGGPYLDKLVGKIEIAGNGSVQVVSTIPYPLESIGTRSEYLISAVLDVVAFDNIVVCAGRKNEPEEPGFWAQHPDLWPPTPYAPDDAFSRHFGDGFGRGLTLLDALKLRGGGTNALARHATAALVNAVSGWVTYPIAAEEVTRTFECAVRSGDRGLIERTKDWFERLNSAPEGRLAPPNPCVSRVPDGAA